jgi:hypothetical protein
MSEKNGYVRDFVVTQLQTKVMTGADGALSYTARTRPISVSTATALV